MKIVLDPRYWNPRGEGIGPLRKLDPRDPGCEFDRRCKVEKKYVILVHISKFLCCNLKLARNLAKL